MAHNGSDAASLMTSASRRHDRAAIGLVIADSYPLYLDALERLFKAEPGFDVLACCANRDDTWSAVVERRPDVLVLDPEITGGTGLLRELAARGFPPRVILLAARLNEHEMLDSMRLGAKGILLKTMAHHLLIQCVRRVHAGGTWLEQTAMAKAVDRLLYEDASSRHIASLLTRRELEVVGMIASGRSSKDIGEALRISAATVKVHLHNIYEKLGVRGRVELTLYARDKGLRSPLLHTASRRADA